MSSISFSGVLIIALVAVAVPAALAAMPRLPVPGAVLEVVAGILAGPSVLGWVHVDASIQVLSDLGLGMLLFLAGLEIDVAGLRGPLGRLAGWAFGGSVLLGLACGYVLSLAGVAGRPVFLAVVLSSTSAGLLLPLLKDAGLHQAPFGQLVMAAAALAELVPVVILSLLFSAASTTPPARLSSLAVFLALLAVIGLALGRVRNLAALGRLLDRLEDRSAQLRVRATLTLTLAFAVLADRFGFASILGTFAAGLLVRIIDLTGRAPHPHFQVKLDGIGFGFLIPVFFIATGVQFDARALVSSPAALAEVPLFLLALLVVRAAPALAYARLAGRRRASAAGLMQATTLTFVIVATQIGVASGQISQATSAALLAAGLLSAALFPVVAVRLLSAGGSAARAPSLRGRRTVRLHRAAGDADSRDIGVKADTRHGQSRLLPRLYRDTARKSSGFPGLSRLDANNAAVDPRGSLGAQRRDSVYRRYSPASARQLRFRRTVVFIALLSLVALVAGCLGRSGSAPVPLRVDWVLSPASNTVTIRVTPPAGPAGRQVLAQSRLAVSENGHGHTGRWSAAGGTVRVPVPAGGQTRLLVQLTGPQPLTRTLTVSTPRPLRVVASGAGSGRWLVYTSGPLRAGPAQTLCGTGKVSLVAPTQVAVSESATACQAQLQLTASSGEQALVPVTIPALSEAKVHAVSVAKLYCFANPAGRAIYITIDDGWTPSAQVLALMHQTYLPITAFLIARAAQENLGYWKAFAAAGGMIGDHTVSHPYLTKLTLPKATAQWGQARTALGRWLGQTPAIGRPPYGAFDRRVEVAAAKGGLTALAGWSATMSGNRIQTWNGKPLSPGEIVILHWVPGLGHQLTVLLAAIRALHLNPAPLTLASFSGQAPQQHSLSGD